MPLWIGLPLNGSAASFAYFNSKGKKWQKFMKQISVHKYNEMREKWSGALDNSS